jgi:hypothetical protein
MLRCNQFSVKSLLSAVTLVALVSCTAQFDSTSKTRVGGRVVYTHNGLPAPGVVVHAQRVTGQEPYGWGRVFTDHQGCYQLPTMPAGEYNIWAESSGFTVTALSNFGCYGTKQTPDLLLIRGGTISGRVIDATTGKPCQVPASGSADIGLHGRSRPKSGAGIARAPVMNDGTFFIRAAPGKNYVYVRWVREDLKLPTAAWVDVTEGETVNVELRVPSEKQTN